MLLMKSTGHYVHRRILKERDKVAYVSGVKDCLLILTDEWASFDDMRTALANTNMVHQRIPTRFMKSRKEERKYYVLAYEHALDIVNSLEKRYVTGSGDKEPRGIAAQGMVYFENENLFD